MKIIYNPIEIDDQDRVLGANIKDWVSSKGKKYQHKIGQILQYSDDEGQEILNNYPFLQNLTPIEAKELIERQIKKAFACEYCDKSFSAEIALKGHMRSHSKEIAAKQAKEEVIDENIPMAEGTNNLRKPIQTSQMTRQANPNYIEDSIFLKDDETNTGDFYGDGFQENHH